MALIQELQVFLMEGKISDAERKAKKALSPYFDRMEKQFGMAFVDEFFDRDIQAWEASVDDAFVQGFRAGGQLMLEALSKYSS